MTKTRGATVSTPRPPASSSNRRVALALDPADASLSAALIATGARLGIEVRVEQGAKRLLDDPGETLAHQLRTEVLATACSAVDLAVSASARARRILGALVGAATSRSEALLREESDGRLSLVVGDHLPVDLGEPPEAAAALRAAQARRNTVSLGADDVAFPPEAEARARAITFGPTRTLSDSSSRRVLETFGFACAPWRLAENAARAAAHARAIGYPVDLRVASPDVSALEEPRLASNELRTPGEVREAYRTLSRELKHLAPDARSLGFTVSRSLLGTPRLRVALVRDGAGDGLRVELDDPIGRRLARPLVVAAPRDLASAAAAIAQFEGRRVLPEPDGALGRGLLELLVRLSRVATVLADTLTSAELAPVVADEADWRIGGARLSVRGIEISA